MTELDATIENLKNHIDYERSKCVGHIFEVMDNMPLIFEECKKENLSEDDAIKKLGNILENLLSEYERIQIPLFFDYIRQSKIKKEQSQSRIIIP